MFEAASDSVLLTGAGGKITRRLVQRLKAEEVMYRAVSRSTKTPFDWKDASTWETAVLGMQTVFLVHPDMTDPGAINEVRRFTQLAVSHGVKRFLFLSGRGESESQMMEQVIAESGAKWTSVRASWFNQNFSEGIFKDLVQSGEMILPTNGGREAFIDCDDIADLLTLLLLSDARKHDGRVYEITGPALISFQEVADHITSSAGIKLKYTDIRLSDFERGLEQEGVPAEIITLSSYLFTQILDGRNQSVTDDFEKVMGRKPRSFKTYTQLAAQQEMWILDDEKENKTPGAIVSNLIEYAINRGDLSAIDDLVHEDYQYQTPNQKLVGAHALKGLFAMYHTAFPDLNVTITDQFESGEKVCTHIRLSGTQTGPMMDIPASGRTIDVTGVVISEVVSGRIQSEWELIDEFSMFQQLGVGA